MPSLITLTTDLGRSDYFVSLLKGELYKTLGTDAQLCEISHMIDPHDIQQAAFFIDVSFRRFPKNSIHVAKVFSYYSKDYEYICFKREGHFFVGPNNGLFSLVFTDLRRDEVYKVVMDDANINTIIGHACGCIQNNLYPDEIGPHPEKLSKKLAIKAVTTSNNIRATIIHVDHYENVILNVTEEMFNRIRMNRRFELFYQQHDPITRISKHYSELPIGDVVCSFNSAGFLELAVNMGSAKKVLNLSKGETIQIYFYDK